MDEQRHLYSQQLSEVEMMSSMFWGDELEVDAQCVERIQKYVNEEASYPNDSITLKLRLENLMLEVRLPSSYPVELPVLSFKVSKLSKTQHQTLQREVDVFISEAEREVGLAALTVQWLSGRVEELEHELGVPVLVEESGAGDNEPDEFMREWIYFHHIYNKEKRKCVLGWANETGLTGFSMTGKPGLVCVEGNKAAVLDYYSRLRALNWKKMTSRLQQVESCGGDTGHTIDSLRVFSEFRELDLDMHGARNNHANIGQLMDYLEAVGMQGVLGVVFPNVRTFDDDK